MQILTRNGGVRAMLAEKIAPTSIGLAWLGQAGFAIADGRHLLLIDPYLSNYLAQKYRTAKFPHTRMMQPPIGAAELNRITTVLCTHRHGDHMDPDTIPLLSQNNPDCRFVVPRAEREAAENLGLTSSSIIDMDASKSLWLDPTFSLEAIPSAHETLKTNHRGEHHFLGYILRLGQRTIYHSGDCVPYEGLGLRLKSKRIDVALLPVNGRDKYRSSHGVPGNMTFVEAERLCESADIPWLVPHHFGMFDFNTVDPGELEKQVRNTSRNVQILIPDVGNWFEIIGGLGYE
jgi:L-ascorbate metabolism protein UlaG (beta-lactamase superfamily)